MLDSGVGYGSQPTYYNYGENVYYQDGAVYNGDQQVATEEEYAQQAETRPERPGHSLSGLGMDVTGCARPDAGR